MATEVSVAAVTVTAAVSVLPEAVSVTVMVAVPTATAVTRPPLAVTVAMFVWSETKLRPLVSGAVVALT